MLGERIEKPYTLVENTLLDKFADMVGTRSLRQDRQTKKNAVFRFKGLELEAERRN